MLGAEELKPVSWRVWAGKIQDETGEAGPFQGLENRGGFVDIRVSDSSLLFEIGRCWMVEDIGKEVQVIIII